MVAGQIANHDGRVLAQRQLDAVHHQPDPGHQHLEIAAVHIEHVTGARALARAAELRAVARSIERIAADDVIKGRLKELARSA